MLRVLIIEINRIKYNSLYDKLLSNVSTYRREKFDVLKNDEVKLQILAATYLIDEYLKTLALREKDMVYKLTKAGKPYFKNHPEINFSISHSKDMVGVAFSDKEVGFDIQVVKKVGDKIYDYVLSDVEKADVFSATNEKERLDRFFKYWVMKEAILKRDGTGLISNMKDINDDYCIVGSLDALNTQGLISKDEIYYYCVNNALDKEITINIL